VQGFGVQRSEASGLRLWGLMRRRFHSPEAFFAEHFVANYCPLLFLDAEGRNLTPDKLPARDREGLYDLCDGHLKRIAEILEPQWMVGIGRFTEGRLRRSFEGEPAKSDSGSRDTGRPALRVAGILHPSPASPAANRGWTEAVEARLRELGIW
jgi:single-strand selective monofunctional uracil DNA glycosylase